MSETELDAAVDRIRTEPGYGQAVADEGGPALASFDLSDEERTAIVAGTRLYAADADVQGFSGKVTFNPFSITRKIDRASPVFFMNEIQIPPGPCDDGLGQLGTA